MASPYTVDFLAALREGIERFESAFEAWMETQSETDAMFMPGMVQRTFTKDEADPSEVQRLNLLSPKPQASPRRPWPSRVRT